jgi:adenylylsulfate kinase-like enzyme
MIPVLWLAGPPGVGKTAVAWEVYRRLQRAGADPAYVDVDQLGICYPPPGGDSDRHTLKACNVAALRANFAAAGARTLIVSGVVDAGRGPGVEALGGSPVVVARLRAEADELRARLRRRDGPSALHEAALQEAVALDASTFAEACIETSGASIAEVATQVIREVGPLAGTSGPGGAPAVGPAGMDAVGEVLWVSGTTGVGKSTIGFRAYLKVLGSGRRAAYIDVEQLGFCSTAPGDPELRARNLAALWRNFYDAGARLAIVTGPAPTRSEALQYERRLPGARFTWRQLQVADAELIQRILSRANGGSWSEPGDPLRGKSEPELREVARRAIVAGQDQHGVRVDVGGLDVEAAAAHLLATARWPA